MRAVLLRLAASVVHPPYCCCSSSSSPQSPFSSTGRAVQADKARDALNYCVKIVQERDYENYVAVLLMPKSAQPRLFAVLAMNAEIATLRHKIKRGSGVAGINQLTFWKEALETFGLGRREALLPRQPVMAAVSAFITPADVPLLLRLVSARQQTLGDRPFADVHALECNSRQLHGALVSLQMRALYAATFSEAAPMQQQMPELEEGAQRAVDAMACAIGILTLLRATVLLLRDDIMLLPQDLTALHGVSAAMARRGPNNLRPVVRDLCEIGDQHLLVARCPSSVGAIRSALRPALLTCGLRADYVLTVLRSNDFNLLDARLQQRHPMSAWKLWWRNKRKTY